MIGTHCPGPANDAPARVPSAATLAGLAGRTPKKLWSTEQHIGSPGLGGSSSNYASPPSWNWTAALGVAKVLNQGYVTANQTSTLIWTPLYSWYSFICYAGKGLIVANEPWSGHYEVPAAAWMVAHTTQFAQPGWAFLASEGACALLGDGVGSVVSYASPDSADVSVVIETAQSNATNTLRLQFQFAAGGPAPPRSLRAWRTNATHVFVPQPPVALDASGGVTLTLPPGEVWTLTTLAGAGRKGTDALAPPPAPAPFVLPYSDDFESYAEDALPRFTSDMHGCFTAARLPGSSGSNTVLRQQTASEPLCTHCPGSTAFVTVLGSAEWIDYSVAATGRAIANDGFLMLGSHIGAFNVSLGKDGLWPYFLHVSQKPPGYILRVWPPGSSAAGGGGGRWELQAGKGTCPDGMRGKGRGPGCPVAIVASGALPAAAIAAAAANDGWLVLRLNATRGSGAPAGQTRLDASANGAALWGGLIATPPVARGAIALGGGLHVQEWDNLTISGL